MTGIYLRVIEEIENHEVNEQTDMILTRLGEEMAGGIADAPALAAALAYLSPKPEADPRPVGRWRRLFHRIGLRGIEMIASRPQAGIAPSRWTDAAAA